MDRAQGDYELTETDQPMNKTENFYRFHLKVIKNADTLFSVRERKLVNDTTNFRNVSTNQVNNFHSLKYFFLPWSLAPRPWYWHRTAR